MHQFGANLMQRFLQVLALGALLFGLAQNAQAQVNVYAGYLNNLSGPPNPADIPTPFDADATTILISSGGVATTHDTGVLRFENICDDDMTIDPGITVT